MDDTIHPNDQIVFAQYPDATLRQTYPPLPRRGGNPNAPVNAGTEMGILSSLESYQRKRGQVPMELLNTPPPPAVELPNDPEVQAMKAAGWL